LLALVLWATLGFAFWSDAQALLARLLPQLPWTGWDWVARWAAVFLLLAALAALTYITATMLVAIFALPLLIRLVAQRDYPELGRHGENVFWASLGNTLAAGAIFIVGSLADAAAAADPRHAAGAAAALGGLAQPAHLPLRRAGRTRDGGRAEAHRRRQPPRASGWPGWSPPARRTCRWSTCWRRPSPRWSSSISGWRPCAACANRKGSNYERHRRTHHRRRDHPRPPPGQALRAHRRDPRRARAHARLGAAGFPQMAW
jgi:hypothetical protein